MPAKAVSFSVQLGSDGFAIARAVAEKLGYRYYDWEITSQAASEAGVTPEAVMAAERKPSLLERVMDRLLAMTVSGAEVPPSMAGSAMVSSALHGLTSDYYRRFIEGIVGQLAEEGDVVIVGHAGQALLKNKAGVLRVLICGSTGTRAQRLAKDEGIPVDEALARIRESDRERTAFFKDIYHLEWLDTSLYDLTMNTDQLSRDVVADLVSAAAKLVQRSAALAVPMGVQAMDASLDEVINYLHATEAGQLLTKEQISEIIEHKFQELREGPRDVLLSKLQEEMERAVNAYISE